MLHLSRSLSSLAVLCGLAAAAPADRITRALNSAETAVHLPRLDGCAWFSRNHWRRIAVMKVEILDDRRRFNHCAIAVNQDRKLACRGEAADGFGVFRVFGVDHQKFEWHVALI